MTEPAVIVVSILLAAPAAGRNEPMEAYHAQARAAVNDVLAEPEFAHLHADPYSVWRAIHRWLSPWLERIEAALDSLPKWVYWLIVAWMLLALVAILAHLLYTLWMMLGGAGRGAVGSAGRPPAGELLGIKDLDFDSVYAEARRRLAAGEWREATKYLYVAAILGLDRQGAIVFRVSKTDRDYRDELAPRPALQDLFVRLTAGFESIVYGGRPATMVGAEDMARSVQGLLYETAGA